MLSFLSMMMIVSLLQINIKLKSEIPVQIDGEPWMQPPVNVIALVLSFYLRNFFACFFFC